MVATKQDRRAMPRPRREPDHKKYSGRIAKRLRELREAQSLTVDELAEKVTKAGYAVSAPTLYAWENGRLQVQLDAIPCLSKALQVLIEDLLPRK